MKFAEDEMIIGEDIEIDNSDANNSSKKPVVVAKLTENKVFVAYRKISSSKTYLYGCIYIINENNIEKGTDTQLAETLGYNLEIAVISSNKVVIIDRNTSTMYGLVCEINNLSITAGTKKILKSGTNTAEYLSIVTLSKTKIMIAYSFDSYRYAYGMICTITDLTISVSTDTKLSDVQNGVRSISISKLSDNKISIAHIDSNNNLHILICTIEDTNIILKFSEIITYARVSSYYSVCVLALAFNKMIIIYTDNKLRLQAYICVIDENGIVNKSSFQLNSIVTKGIISAIILSSNRILILFNHDNENKLLYGMICTITGLTISEGIVTQVSNESYSGDVSPSIALLSSELAFLGYSKTANYYISGKICQIGKTKISKIKENEVIAGIAKTSGIDGQLVKYARPSFIESEEN